MCTKTLSAPGRLRGYHPVLWDPHRWDVSGSTSRRLMPTGDPQAPEQVHRIRQAHAKDLRHDRLREVTGRLT